ncbi:alanine racemase [Hoeflea prorocentri]|uniref:Alanine racemase n=1 Tax=Hoeflea prorocentri TaxID=1922333 RepID=A0A9X3UIW1_9HYPH|nr:alanine racemase [Hoeflea prorocentri]MCY6381416.1 alanine racemase [Hoeflea prorocentri]MDA5399216.1 alanine racemase [Hoeflea prorocentri]
MNERHNDKDHDIDEGYGARLTIDLQALADNWRVMRDRSHPARCAAVIKADGYGIGAPEVATTLYAAGCRDFFVATAREGAIIRVYAPQARIFVMNCILPGIEETCRAAELVPVLASMEHVAIWTNACIANGDHPCALQVDTGMNRLGITSEEALSIAGDVTRPAGFSPVLLMSHLACGDTPDHPLNHHQLEAFRAAVGAFDGVEASLSNSAGVLLGPEYRFDLTRPGIMLFGGSVGDGVNTITRPVVTAEARIITIRHAKRGETVSYGATVTLERDSRIAICSIGYADGYPRSLSGSGVPLRNAVRDGAHAFAAGQRLPLLGRVTMDMTAFDITDLPDNTLRAGDFVELFGKNVALDDVARAGGTIGYELLTSLGQRYRRHCLPAENED